MIGRISGILLEKQPPHLLVDVNDVAYELQAPMTTFYRLGDLAARITLYTHLSISENNHQLFGFIDKKDRELFRLLIKVSGVGPKLGIAILSMEVDDFVNCVLGENVSALVKLPGVGKKTAERLVVETKDKLKAWKTDLDSSQPPISGQNSPSTDDILEEARSALVTLGYRSNDALKVVTKISQQQTLTKSEDLIRAALKSMIPS